MGGQEPGRPVASAHAHVADAADAADSTGRGLRVLAPGPQSLVQDLGRPGLAHLGVGAAGAMDRGAHGLAQRLIGNPASAAGLEILLGGVELEATAPLWFALAGARGPASAGGRAVSALAATFLDAGERLVVGPAERGIRYYLAVRGGIALPPVLGSRSRDTLASLGPAPLAARDHLAVGAEPVEPIPPVDLVPVDAPPEGLVTLELRPGPRRDWFDDSAWEHLMGSDWLVSPRSGRSGIRLDGPVLERPVLEQPLLKQGSRGTLLGELPSEGMVPGAIQVSPDGAPTILAVDHPVTGGYPVIAVVTDASLDSLAQLRPGQPLRFRQATGR